MDIERELKEKMLDLFEETDRQSEEQEACIQELRQRLYLASDMPFADYLLEWLDIVKVRVKATTFSSYEQMVKSVIEPYFRKKAVTLQGLEARHIQQFYSEKLKTVKPNSVIHYHAVIHQALKYAMKTDLVAQNVVWTIDL